MEEEEEEEEEEEKTHNSNLHTLANGAKVAPNKDGRQFMRRSRIFVVGGGVGSRPDGQNIALTTFFSPQLILQYTRWGPMVL